ncbi:MAG TPA: amidase [Gemmatimonadetes bacterium]|nr:amidase [Gemmatimonadota bacterium]
MRLWAVCVKGPRILKLLITVVALLCSLPAPANAQIEVTEASIPELQEAMETGAVTSAEITRMYLSRIRAYDKAGPVLNAMIWVNWDAVAEAQMLDRERARTGPRGALHGIPIILKDNYDTFDLPTSAGTLALAANIPPDDARQVQKLREAGVVILGKSNMHELASGITTIGSLGGQTLNPYDLRRNPGGSSGGTGTAIAASFAAVGWGSDTCGSIRIPSSQNNLVGLRPTKGLSSIDGIVPLSHTQDVGGPLARSIEDLAIALDATIGADPADPATTILEGRELPSFVSALDPSALSSARIGILESYFGEGGVEAPAANIVRQAIAKMVELGADTITIEIPNLQNLISGSGVIGHEFKWDLIDYLAAVPDAPVSSLEEMLELGLIHEALTPGMRRRNAPESRDTDAYATALAKREPLRNAVVSVIEENQVDALIYPTMREPPSIIGQPQRGSNCSLSANTGLPALSIPAGWTGGGLPIGLELLGRSLDDARLVALGYAYEQATNHRRAPVSAPPLLSGRAARPITFTVRTIAGGASGSTVRARARVHFTYNPLTGSLAYKIRVSGVRANDVFALVLSTNDEEGRPYIERRLSGPSVAPAQGMLTLDTDERQRLESGEFYLELMTRNYPFGTGRKQVLPVRR